MSISPIAMLERRLFVFSVSGLLACLAIICVVGFAAFAGKTTVEHSFSAQQAFTTEYETSLAEWEQSLQKIEQTGAAESPYDARPMNLRIPAVLPTAPLGDFAIGNAQLFPTATTISGWASSANLFAEYEFDNPTPLSLGSFDLTFVVVVLMPLLMIAVSFDILTGDRERGRARLIAMQAGHVAPSVWRRLTLRNGLLWGVFTVVATIAALFVPSGIEAGDRLAHFAAWLGIALAYGLFWFAAVGLASALLKRGETVASALFAAWTIFVFAIPAVGGAIAEASYPPPSRLAYLSEMREGEVIAVRETADLTAGFLADHPDMTVSDEGVPGYFSNSFLANEQARIRTTPVLEAFNKSREQRSALVSGLQYFSPAMIADRAMTFVAGGDVDRNLAFQQQARSALHDLAEQIGPAVVARQRITLSEYEAIPAFEFSERTLTSTMATLTAPLGFLLLLSLAVLFAARRSMAAPLERLL
ncbi:MAG: DUF3526 domain-containing protein [Parasphingorhabdus sp.]